MDTIPTFHKTVTRGGLLIYVVSIGRKHTYISHRSTRFSYKTFFDNIHEFKATHQSEAKERNDELIEYWIVNADNRKKVVNAFCIDA